MTTLLGFFNAFVAGLDECLETVFHLPFWCWIVSGVAYFFVYFLFNFRCGGDDKND